METIKHSFVVAAAIAQYLAVKATSVAGTAAVATANSANLGITGAPTTLVGEDVPVVMFGETEALLGATVTRGTHFFLKSDANGALVPVDTTAAVAQYAVAMVLEGGVANDIVRVFVCPTVLMPGLATDPYYLLAGTGDVAAGVAVLMESDTAVVAAGANGIAIGISKSAVAVGLPIGIAVNGVVTAKAGAGGWTRADRLKSHTDGTLVITATTGTTVQNVIALALTTVGANGTGPVLVVHDSWRPALA